MLRRRLGAVAGSGLQCTGSCGTRKRKRPTPTNCKGRQSNIYQGSERRSTFFLSSAYAA